MNGASRVGLLVTLWSRIDEETIGPLPPDEPVEMGTLDEEQRLFELIVARELAGECC